MLAEHEVACPYCGAVFTALVDPDDAGADYIQDCEVCCQPIRFSVQSDPGGDLMIEVACEDDP